MPKDNLREPVPASDYTDVSVTSLPESISAGGVSACARSRTIPSSSITRGRSMEPSRRTQTPRRSPSIQHR